MEATLLRTPLYECHVALGARMVPFAGYEMPVQYEGVIPEHKAVRTDTGVFDVSHMIEPTETEPKERLDDFVHAMQAIAREAAEAPELLKEAPHGRPVRRLDEVRAAKQPVLRYLFDEHPALVS